MSAFGGKADIKNSGRQSIIEQILVGPARFVSQMGPYLVSPYKESGNGAIEELNWVPTLCHDASRERSRPMLRWFLQRQIAAFERTWNYDASYMHEVIGVDPRAMLAFGIRPNVPHLPDNLSQMETCVAIIARTDPNDQESVVLLPELEKVHRSTDSRLQGAADQPSPA